MSKPSALMIGGSDRHADALAKHFTLHRAGDIDALVAEFGGDIQYVLYFGHTPFDAALMAQLPNLRIISNFGVGYDAIDVEEAVKRGIMVTHTPDVLNDEVANTALLLLLAVARNFLSDNAYLHAGKWESDGNAPLSRSISAMTVGILGLGRIGKAFAEKLGMFGSAIVYHGRSQQDVAYKYYDDLEEMAQAVDALVCIAPGGAGTRHLIDQKVIEALGPKSILINVGRGSVVDETALIKAMQSGRLGFAGLDVFENEPHVPQALMDLPNVTLLPHVGSATIETRQAMGDLAVRNLIDFYVDGQPVTPVPECKGT